MVEQSSIEIDLEHIESGLKLWIDAKKSGTLYDALETAIENNEARFQLIEGCYYDYELNKKDYKLDDIGENIIQSNKRNPNIGVLSPNIFVGTLEIPILKVESNEKCDCIEIEVQSIKSNYREDYRNMLEYITEKSTELLLQSNSPASHYFEVDYSKETQSLYQKFAFIKSIINSEEFKDSVHRIVTSPVTKWAEATEHKDIRRIRRFTNSNVKELVKGGNRSKLPRNHYLNRYGINSIPKQIESYRKVDSIDTPENRFVKHALETYIKFCTDINKASTNGSKLYKESKSLIAELVLQLGHTVFKHISKPTTLKLNSPILQRKEGYREVLRSWLMFELSAKLIWKGGDDVYGAGKKDIATLYEYWLFFKLLDLFQEIFELEKTDIDDLLEVSDNGLNLKLKQGESTAINGLYRTESRKFNILYSFNRTFDGRNTYPNPGSWTTKYRPDYTLSFWPYGISDIEAENQELIVHIHFDAKYKIANLSDFLDKNFDEDLSQEKIANRKGIYKNADLIKMHAYKDAIRRTGGAYVLYPGDKSLKRLGFHEVIPGLGAFPVKPSKTDSGISELKSFIYDVIDHFINRASQREKLAFRTYDIYKDPPSKDSAFNEPLPEPYNDNRDLIPDDTYVLVGFYNTEDQHEWIRKQKLYNFRMGSGLGSLVLDRETVSSKYLLLHTHGDDSSSELWKIVSRGPKIYSKDDLLRKGYLNPSQDYYLVIEIEKVEDPEFENVSWNFKELTNYQTGRASSFPFTTSLSELMKNKMI